VKALTPLQGADRDETLGAIAPTLTVYTTMGEQIKRRMGAPPCVPKSESGAVYIIAIEPGIVRPGRSPGAAATQTPSTTSTTATP
jgi:hypothetical protein